MKIHIDLPWGGHLHIEREPMSYERFCWICGLVAFALFVKWLTS